MGDPIENLARLAAEHDSREGGYRMGLNFAALISWAGKLRLEHAPCGKLEVESDAKGQLTGARCRVHGHFDAPEWIEADG